MPYEADKSKETACASGFAEVYVAFSERIHEMLVSETMDERIEEMSTITDADSVGRMHVNLSWFIPLVKYVYRAGLQDGKK